MWHATCMQGNQGNSQLLTIGSQIANLIFGFSFGHNLYFMYPNGSCKAILDIWVPRTFQWYKKIFNPMNFDPCNCPLKILESIETLIPKVGTRLGVCGFIPSHSPPLSKAWNVTPKLHSWPLPLQALILVVSPRLRLWQFWWTLLPFFIFDKPPYAFKIVTKLTKYSNTSCIC